MLINYLQHVPFEGLGSIAVWAAEKGHTVTVTRLFAGDSLPAVEGFDLLVIMGGPMGVSDEDKFPWLAAEKKFIKEVIAGGRPVVGICLGAQLIAEVLGAAVTANPFKEIGWLPIRKEKPARGCALASFLPDEAVAFHWHGDTFDLPAGAVRLAASEGCRNQGFIYDNRVVGLQFHLETTRESLQALIDNCRHEIGKGKYIQSEQAMTAGFDRYGPMVNTMMAGLLDGLAAYK